MQEEGSPPKDLKERPGPEEPKLALKDRLLYGGIWIEIDDAPEGKPAFRIIEGKLFIDRKSLDRQKSDVKQALADSIANGNSKLFEKLTKGLSLTADEELKELYNQLKKAFEERQTNPFELGRINVDLLTDGISERNIIREGLKPQIKKQPFIFRDKNGDLLDSENDLDFVFVKDKSKGYKLIVGSKRGIDSIELPEELEKDQFTPSLLSIKKDPVMDVITIPLKQAKNGDEPLVSDIEIRKGPIDIIKKAAAEESMAQQEKRRKELEDRYSPPPPRPPRKSSESGGYGYTSASH